MSGGIVPAPELPGVEVLGAPALELGVAGSIDEFADVVGVDMTEYEPGKI